jgi:hypothetical protein
MSMQRGMVEGMDLQSASGAMGGIYSAAQQPEPISISGSGTGEITPDPETPTRSCKYLGNRAGARSERALGPAVLRGPALQ